MGPIKKKCRFSSKVSLKMNTCLTHQVHKSFYALFIAFTDLRTITQVFIFLCLIKNQIQIEFFIP